MKDRANNPFLKVCASVVAGIFAFTTAAQSAPIAVSPLRQQDVFLPSLARTLEIPEFLGTIRERHEPLKTPAQNGMAEHPTTIIHIQDAHSSLEAQISIRNILEHLKAAYEVDAVFLEGVTHEIHSDAFRFFGEDETNRKLAQMFLQDSLIGGTELFMLDEAIRTGKAQKAYGVEDPAIYRKNLEDFQLVYQTRKETDAFVHDLESQLLTLGPHFLNQELKAFFREWVFYQNVPHELMRHLDTLRTYAGRHLAIDLSQAREQKQWPQLVRFFKLKALESGHDKRKVLEEHQKLKRWMREKGLSPDLTRPDSWHETPRRRVETFYEAAKELGFSFRDYPHLTRHWGIRILQSEIQTTLLMNEIQRLTQRLLDHLAKREEEKAFLLLYQDSLLLQRLFSLELTNSDYQNIRDKGETIKPSSVMQRVEDLHDRVPNRSKDHSPTHRRAPDPSFFKALEFYRGAVEREKAIFEKMTAKMKELNAGQAVLITGGFHAQGLQALMRAQGLAYVEVLPQIGDVETNTAYHDVMTLQGDYVTSRSYANHPSLGEGLRRLPSQIGPHAVTVAGLAHMNLSTVMARMNIPIEFINQSPAGRFHTQGAGIYDPDTYIYVALGYPVTPDGQTLLAHTAHGPGSVPIESYLRSEARNSQNGEESGKSLMKKIYTATAAVGGGIVIGAALATVSTLYEVDPVTQPELDAARQTQQMEEKITELEKKLQAQAKVPPEAIQAGVEVVLERRDLMAQAKALGIPDEEGRRLSNEEIMKKITAIQKQQALVQAAVEQGRRRGLAEADIEILRREPNRLEELLIRLNEQVTLAKQYEIEIKDEDGNPKAIAQLEAEVAAVKAQRDAATAARNQGLVGSDLEGLTPQNYLQRIEIVQKLKDQLTEALKQAGATDAEIEAATQDKTQAELEIYLEAVQVFGKNPIFLDDLDLNELQEILPDLNAAQLRHLISPNHYQAMLEKVLTPTQPFQRATGVDLSPDHQRKFNILKEELNQVSSALGLPAGDPDVFNTIDWYLAWNRYFTVNRISPDRAEKLLDRILIEIPRRIAFYKNHGVTGKTIAEYINQPVQSNSYRWQAVGDPLMASDQWEEHELASTLDLPVRLVLGAALERARDWLREDEGEDINWKIDPLGSARLDLIESIEIRRNVYLASLRNPRDPRLRSMVIENWGMARHASIMLKRVLPSPPITERDDLTLRGELSPFNGGRARIDWERHTGRNRPNSPFLPDRPEGFQSGAREPLLFGGEYSGYIERYLIHRALTKTGSLASMFDELLSVDAGHVGAAYRDAYADLIEKHPDALQWQYPIRFTKPKADPEVPGYIKNQTGLQDDEDETGKRIRSQIEATFVGKARPKNIAATMLLTHAAQPALWETQDPGNFSEIFGPESMAQNVDYLMRLKDSGLVWELYRPELGDFLIKFINDHELKKKGGDFPAVNLEYRLTQNPVIVWNGVRKPYVDHLADAVEAQMHHFPPEIQASLFYALKLHRWLEKNREMTRALKLPRYDGEFYVAVSEILQGWSITLPLLEIADGRKIKLETYEEFEERVRIKVRLRRATKALEGRSLELFLNPDDGGELSAAANDLVRLGIDLRAYVVVSKLSQLPEIQAEALQVWRAITGDDLEAFDTKSRETGPLHRAFLRWWAVYRQNDESFERMMNFLEDEHRLQTIIQFASWRRTLFTGKPGFQAENLKSLDRNEDILKWLIPEEKAFSESSFQLDQWEMWERTRHLTIVEMADSKKMVLSDVLEVLQAFTAGEELSPEQRATAGEYLSPDTLPSDPRVEQTIQRLDQWIQRLNEISQSQLERPAARSEVRKDADARQDPQVLYETILRAFIQARVVGPYWRQFEEIGDQVRQGKAPADLAEEYRGLEARLDQTVKQLAVLGEEVAAMARAAAHAAVAEEKTSIETSLQYHRQPKKTLKTVSSQQSPDFKDVFASLMHSGARVNGFVALTAFVAAVASVFFFYAPRGWNPLNFVRGQTVPPLEPLDSATQKEMEETVTELAAFKKQIEEQPDSDTAELAIRAEAAERARDEQLEKKAVAMRAREERLRGLEVSSKARKAMNPLRVTAQRAARERTAEKEERERADEARRAADLKKLPWERLSQEERNRLGRIFTDPTTKPVYKTTNGVTYIAAFSLGWGKQKQYKFDVRLKEGFVVDPRRVRRGERLEYDVLYHDGIKERRVGAIHMRHLGGGVYDGLAYSNTKNGDRVTRSVLHDPLQRWWAFHAAQGNFFQEFQERSEARMIEAELFQLPDDETAELLKAAGYGPNGEPLEKAAAGPPTDSESPFIAAEALSRPGLLKRVWQGFVDARYSMIVVLSILVVMGGFFKHFNDHRIEEREINAQRYAEDQKKILELREAVVRSTQRIDRLSLALQTATDGHAPRDRELEDLKKEYKELTEKIKQFEQDWNARHAYTEEELERLEEELKAIVKELNEGLEGYTNQLLQLDETVREMKPRSEAREKPVRPGRLKRMVPLLSVSAFLLLIVGAVYSVFEEQRIEEREINARRHHEIQEEVDAMLELVKANEEFVREHLDGVQTLQIESARMSQTLEGIMQGVAAWDAATRQELVLLKEVSKGFRDSVDEEFFEASSRYAWELKERMGLNEPEPFFSEEDLRFIWANFRPPPNLEPGQPWRLNWDQMLQVMEFQKRQRIINPQNHQAPVQQQRNGWVMQVRDPLQQRIPFIGEQHPLQNPWQVCPGGNCGVPIFMPDPVMINPEALPNNGGIERQDAPKDWRGPNPAGIHWRGDIRSEARTEILQAYFGAYGLRQGTVIETAKEVTAQILWDGHRVNERVFEALLELVVPAIAEAENITDEEVREQIHEMLGDWQYLAAANVINTQAGGVAVISPEGPLSQQGVPVLFALMLLKISGVDPDRKVIIGGANAAIKDAIFSRDNTLMDAIDKANVARVLELPRSHRTLEDVIQEAVKDEAARRAVASQVSQREVDQIGGVLQQVLSFIDDSLDPELPDLSAVKKAEALYARTMMILDAVSGIPIQPERLKEKDYRASIVGKVKEVLEKRYKDLNVGISRDGQSIVLKLSEISIKLQGWKATATAA